MYAEFKARKVPIKAASDVLKDLCLRKQLRPDTIHRRLNLRICPVESAFLHIGERW